ncbi:uncharacterized protein DUF4389 [Alteromonadaceae bacterium 2753L.S.0a.02]|nr:uncharacterized protein DUF4389 [Alteromonadaceae bacterium 2753L.S.0a.02]
MDEQLKSNLTSGKHWLRLVFMLLFAVLLQVSLAVMWVLVAIQFIFALITGKDNLNLRSFGDSLSQYIFKTIQFLTYNSEEKPFPFSDWPESQAVVEEVVVEENVEETAAQQSETSPAAEIAETEAVSEEPAEPTDSEKKAEN